MKKLQMVVCLGQDTRHGESTIDSPLTSRIDHGKNGIGQKIDALRKEFRSSQMLIVLKDQKNAILESNSLRLCQAIRNLG